jgi:hypothetical protein
LDVPDSLLRREDHEASFEFHFFAPSRLCG